MTPPSSQARICRWQWPGSRSQVGLADHVETRHSKGGRGWMKGSDQVKTLRLGSTLIPGLIIDDQYRVMRVKWNVRVGKSFVSPSYLIPLSPTISAQTTMRIKDSRVKIQSPPSTFSTSRVSKASASSHCSKCSHCHPSKTRSASSASTGRTTSVKGLEQSAEPPNALSRSLARRLSLPVNAAQFQSTHPSYPPMPHNQPMPFQHYVPDAMQMSMPMPMAMGMPMMNLHEPRLHPFAPAPVLHDLGRGPEPLFGWDSVMPLNHAYGQPKYIKRVKPDYRRFCFSVGKADVPFAAMPGGPLWGMDVTMAPQMIGSRRW
jgi:hypothetical protein